jgi:hypothetical protein
MTQFYTDPSREESPTALPNAEVFYAKAGEWAYDPDGERVDAPSGDDECLEEGASLNPEGYYYWPCFPGCLPDGEPIGPFATEEEAIADARSDFEGA